MKEELDKLQKAAIRSQVFTNMIKKVSVILRPISKLAMIKKTQQTNKTKLTSGF